LTVNAAASGCVSFHDSPHAGQDDGPEDLAIGQSGEVTATAQCKDAFGRWVTAPNPHRFNAWEGAVYIRGENGLRQEIHDPPRGGRAKCESSGRWLNLPGGSSVV
jgi:hypothetical protein